MDDNCFGQQEISQIGRFLVGPGTVGPPKREADYDHRDIYRNDVGIARQIARSDPFGVNAVRTKRASVVGQGLKLNLVPDHIALGVTPEAAAEWAQNYTSEFNSWANSAYFECDASRKQTLTGLFWTAYDSLYVSGEAVAVMKFKKAFGPYETCLHLLEPERISTPYERVAQKNIRQGVERDEDLAPIAYHISRRPLAPFISWGVPPFYWKWDRVTRYTDWGRPQILHSFQHLRPDMTRGISTFASVIKQMRMLKQYSDTELQSAITQAAYAAVVKTELDYEDAMKVVGAMDPKKLRAYGGNPIAAAMFEYMKLLGPFYGDMGLQYQGGKIPHLAPNDSLDVLRSTHPNNQFSAFEGAMLRQLCAGLGIDYPALSKNYAEVNYSGARAALADVWRSYECERVHLSQTFGMPIVNCHMEEALLKGRIPMLGKKPWIEARMYLVRGGFTGWGKPMIDPQKERAAQRLALDMGVDTRTRMAAENGDDMAAIIQERAFEEKQLKDAGLTPEVLMPELQPSQNADAPKNPEAASGRP
jgi:lambda family phage portal protein